MKKRRLPETDIANLSFLPPMQKEKVLESWLQPRKIVGSYEPFRLSLADALNAQLPLIKGVQCLSELEHVEQAVRRRCRGDADLVAMNLCVVRATHEFAAENDVTAYPLEARPLYFPGVHPYDFSLPMVAVYDSRARIVFTDMRRKGQLSSHARRVVFSAQHARIRERYPELRDAVLEIWRYRDVDSRAIEVIECGPDRLYTFEQLAEDFYKTVSILNRLREGQQDDFRTWNQDNPGPLFGTGS